MIACGYEKMDKERLRKRPRMTWDEAPAEPEAKRAVIKGHGSDWRVLSPPLREDDRDGHYVFSLRENLTPRYKILSKMGEGTFGRVLECWDRDTKEYVAIKIIRSIKKYRDAAMIEIDVLQKLVNTDKGRTRFVQMKNWFDYRNHICIVFEKLGPSLFDFVKPLQVYFRKGKEVNRSKLHDEVVANSNVEGNKGAGDSATNKREKSKDNHVRSGEMSVLAVGQAGAKEKKD